MIDPETLTRYERAMWDEIRRAHGEQVRREIARLDLSALENVRREMDGLTRGLSEDARIAAWREVGAPC